MQLPPAFPHAVRQGPPCDASIHRDARLVRLLGEIRTACGSIEAARIVCHGLRALMGSEPSFEHGDVTPVRGVPLSPEAILAKWARHEFVDSLSIATLALQLLVESGVDCRLIEFSEGRTHWSRTRAGLELWHELQSAWFLLDPSTGLVFNRSNGFLPAGELRDSRESGSRFEVTPLIHPLPVTPVGRHELLYAERVRELYVALSPYAWEAAREQLHWGLVEQPNRHRFDLVARRELAGVTAVLLSIYLLLLLLVQLRASSHAVGPGCLESSRACEVGRVSENRRSLLRSMLAAARGHVTWLASRLLPVLAILRHGIDWTSSSVIRLWTSLGTARARVLTSVLLLGKGVALYLGLAARAVVEPARKVHGYWQRLDGSREVSRRPRLSVFVGTLLLGSALLVLHVAVSDISLEEDAFIGFRFARNLALGHGLCFNAEAPPVEGFSNTLWLLLLAAGFKVWPDMVQVSLALALLFGMLQLALVAWMACRAGDGAWFPVLMLATNISFAHSITSGLETPLCSFLTLLAACLWIAELPKPSDGQLAMTSVVCWFVTLARADGWFLFVGLSFIRVVSGGGRTAGRSLRYWWCPYMALTSAYLAVRWSYFGSVVPYIYYGRLLHQRGELVERLLPGLQYLAAALLWNPSLLMGLAGLGLIVRLRSMARLSLAVMLQFALVVLVGGDAGYITYYRFIMPAAGLMALLAHRAYVELAIPGRKTAVAGATLALVLAGNLQVLPGYSDCYIFQINPLVVSVSQGLAGFSDALQRFSRSFARGEAHYASHTFDGSVSTHLSRSVDTDGELGCDQAGKMAYFWNGPFFDLGGLVMPGPPGGQFLLEAHHRPRWYLLVFEQLRDHWPALARSGYRIERVYASGSGGLDYLRYCLLVRSGKEGVRMTPSLFDRVDLRWWLLPKERIVLMIDGEGAVVDGPRRSVDYPGTGSLVPPYVAWLENSFWSRSGP